MACRDHVHHSKRGEVSRRPPALDFDLNIPPSPDPQEDPLLNPQLLNAHPRQKNARKYTQIEDLPDDLLVQILCRLPSYKFIPPSKCVSKRWYSLMFNTGFSKRFLTCQSENQTPIMKSLISCEGHEFLGRMSPTNDPLAHLLTKLMTFYSLEYRPVIVATYNDLVLCTMCSATEADNECDYFICNPCTLQWISLPRPPQVYEYTQVGFICDLPYYTCDQDDQGRHVIQLNPDYRCKVVRIVCPADHFSTVSNDIRVQIFSSDTGEWKETIVSCPSAFAFEQLYGISFACNRMLYWKGFSRDGDGFIIGLDPFMINNDMGADQYTCRFLKLEKEYDYEFWDSSVHKQGLRLFKYYYGEPIHVLSVIDLVEEYIDDETGRFSVEKTKVYSLDSELVPVLDQQSVDLELLAFDPSDDDVLIVGRYQLKDIVMFNLRTKKLTKLAAPFHLYDYQYPVHVPWWPTPLPKRAPKVTLLNL